MIGKASAAGGVSLRRCAAPSLRSQTDGFGSLSCLYRDRFVTLVVLVSQSGRKLPCQGLKRAGARWRRRFDTIHGSWASGRPPIAVGVACTPLELVLAVLHGTQQPNGPILCQIWPRKKGVFCGVLCVGGSGEGFGLV